MNINESYKFVQDIANKEQRGYLPSDKFNRYAERAQMEVFMKRYGNPHEYQPGKPVPRIAFEMTQKILDDLDVFLKKKVLNLNRRGEVSKPSDFVHSAAMSYKLYVSGKDTPTIVPIKIIASGKLAGRLSSKIVGPTKYYPICNVIGTTMIFYPANLSVVNMTYLGTPVSPKWAFTIVNGREVYDPDNSVDFEFPDEVHNEICFKILGYFGIKIRDKDMSAMVEAKSVQGI